APIIDYAITVSPGDRKIVTSGVSALVSGLTNGTSYAFTVRARNVRGEGPPSLPSAEVTPVGVPGAPTDVEGRPGDGRVFLSWKAPANDGGRPITSYSILV